MTDFIKVEFPEGCDEFQKGMIMLDEAVGFFMREEGINSRIATSFEYIIGMLVRGYENEKDE
jgi:hypothetical protein